MGAGLSVSYPHILKGTATASTEDGKRAGFSKKEENGSASRRKFVYQHSDTLRLFSLFCETEAIGKHNIRLDMNIFEYSMINIVYTK